MAYVFCELKKIVSSLTFSYLIFFPFFFYNILNVPSHHTS